MRAQKWTHNCSAAIAAYRGSCTHHDILYGAFLGGVVGLVPAGVVALSPGLSKVGARVGTTLTLASILLLVGLLVKKNWRALEVTKVLRNRTYPTAWYVVAGCPAQPLWLV